VSEPLIIYLLLYLVVCSESWENRYFHFIQNRGALPFVPLIWSSVNPFMQELYFAFGLIQKNILLNLSEASDFFFGVISFHCTCLYLLLLEFSNSAPQREISVLLRALLQEVHH